jgi:Mat/Ecp fimbriae major subunit
MNKTFKALALTGVAMLGFSGTAASAATANADARATILRQITVTKTADLDYATIVTGAAASTVQVSTAGVRTCGSGLVCTGTVTAAGFSVVGTVGQVATVSVPATVTLTSGANTMSSTLVSSTSSITLAALNSFTVGGTLSVGANQADGVYLGNFTVTVDYQ